MLDIAETRIRKGVFRLTRGPTDVSRWDSRIGAISIGAASPEHRQLFEQYTSELHAITQQAALVWMGELQGWAAEGRTHSEANREMWSTYPAGPAAQPFYVALIRRYWLACDALNKRVALQVAVRPEHFLLGWLLDDSKYEDMVEVIACMPYWPIGIDHGGHWI